LEKKVADAMLEESFDFEVTVNAPGFLHKLGLLPKSRVFSIKPLCLGSLVRISKILMDIEKFDLTRPLMEIAPEQIVKHAKSLAEIIAIAVTNSPAPPSYGLVCFLYDNLTAAELFEVIERVKKQMDVADFLASIVSAKGMNVFQAATEATPETSGAPSAE